jgi:hypothetical protein
MNLFGGARLRVIAGLLVVVNGFFRRSGYC